MKLFVFGVGYSGSAVARAALEGGASAAGTTRSPEKAEKLRRDGLDAHIFDGAAVPAALRDATHLLVTVAPGEADPVPAAARATIMPALRWIGYLSTVGVYGDHGGAWVDETTPCRPASQRSMQRLEAERQWRALGDERRAPVAIMRLPGIYGPGRNALLDLERGRARRIVKPGQVFNRIHVEDIAGAALLLARNERGGVFNVTDDLPAPPQDVVAHAASLMGVEPPPETAFDEAEMSAMARSFYGENKRVSNARLEGEGYRLLFPDYRVGLGALWRSGEWRGRKSADGLL